MSNNTSNFEDGAVVRFGVAGSKDRTPSLVIDGGQVSDAYILTAADNSLQDLTFECHVPAVSVNQLLDISVIDGAILVELASTLANAATKILASDSDNTDGILTLTADVAGVSGNGATGGLKVAITDPGPNDCALSASMGGTGNNTLTIVLGRTGVSTASVKNTVILIEGVINGIVTNKKITAAASGDTAKKITVTAVAANFTGGVNRTVTAMTAQHLVDALNDTATWTDMDGVATAALFDHDKDNGGATNTGAGSIIAGCVATPFVDTDLSGDGVSVAGYQECLVIVSLGTFDPASTLDITIEDSPDNVTFTAIDGAVFGPFDLSDSNTIHTGVLRLRVSEIDKYIHAVSVVTGDFAEHSVLFVLGGGQYSDPANRETTFII